MNFETTQHLLVRKSALFVLLVTTIATIVRPMIAEQDIAFTLIGVGNMVLMAAVYALVSLTPARSYHAYLVIITGFITLIPLLLVSGGVNSQFAFILPVIPVLVCLLTTSTVAWIVTGFVLLLILFMRTLIDAFPNFAFESVSIQKTNARTFWLGLTCLLSATFASEFYRLSRKLSHKLQYQASIDALTGVSNRATVMTFLEAALLECEPENQWLTVMMVDADEFKKINDRYGHLAGDECLKRIAAALEKSIRKQSDSVGRYGGEEFLVVLPTVDQTSAHRIAENIRAAVNQIQLNYKGTTIEVSATVGYCSMPVSQYSTIDEYLSQADSALYAGKHAGRNTVMGAEQSDVIAASV